MLITREDLEPFCKPNACLFHFEYDRDSKHPLIKASAGDGDTLMMALGATVCSLSDQMFGGNDADFIDDLRTRMLLYRNYKENEHEESDV